MLVRVISRHGSNAPSAARPLLAVDLRKLTKRFAAVIAVDDLSLQIASGEIVAFLGPNGAGKTTTIDMILGILDEPTV
jgi:ABC-2 type transport system ATP-binding protein